MRSGIRRTCTPNDYISSAIHRDRYKLKQNPCLCARRNRPTCLQSLSVFKRSTVSHAPIQRVTALSYQTATNRSQIQRWRAESPHGKTINRRMFCLPIFPENVTFRVSWKRRSWTISRATHSHISASRTAASTAGGYRIESRAGATPRLKREVCQVKRD